MREEREEGIAKHVIFDPFNMKNGEHIAHVHKRKGMEFPIHINDMVAHEEVKE